MCPLFDVDQFAPLSLFDGEQCSSICSSICTTGTGTGTTGTTRPFVRCSLLSSPQSAQLMNVAGPIPVTRVSNGQGGWADLILTKDKRPPSLCRQCTAVVFLGLTNTCCNRNGPSTSSRIELLSELTNSVQTSHLWENGIPMLATCK